MNANELRIGNYYEIFDHKFNPDFNGVRCFELETASEIFKAFSDGSIFKISGIPLTEEWLLRFGFKLKFDNIYTYPFKVSDNFVVDIKFEGWPENISLITNEYFSSNSVKYVHQLQNLYFALTGEELTL